MQCSDAMNWTSDDWKCIDDPSFMTLASNKFCFTIANILNYFIHRKALDGNPTNDYKDINSKAYPLYKAGFIQSVLFNFNDASKIVMMKGTCAAEMKKTVMYSLRIAFQNNDIIYATCGCPAGRGPTGICKHIGALCYFIEDLCRTKIATYQSSTSSLQQWHQPTRKRKSSPRSFDGIKFVKAEYGKVKKEMFVKNRFDPRPSNFAQTTAEDIVHLHNQLQKLSTPIGLLHILPLNHCPASETPSTSSLLPPITKSALSKVRASFQQQPKPPTLQAILHHGLLFINMIHHNREDREKIEENTRKQSKSPRWFEEHYG